MSKKHDLPAMPFYWGDWFKCPEVRALTPQARCLWFEMMGLMWESTERGFLTINNKPYPTEALARCLGFASDLLDTLLAEMEQFAIYSTDERGAIYSRRMVRDEEIRVKRAIAGQKGGICSSKNKANYTANIQASTEDENEDENENAGVNNNWKKSYEIYKNIELIAYQQISSDGSFMIKQQEFYPNLNIKLSLKKAHENFWSQKGGWQNKKKSRAKEIDWNQTYVNALSMRSNQVYMERNAAPKFGRQEVTADELKESVKESLRLMEEKDADKTNNI